MLNNPSHLEVFIYFLTFTYSSEVLNLCHQYGREIFNFHLK